MEVAPKRSARQKTAKVKIFDEATRREIKRKRLDSLEKDNWHEERRLEDEDDDDYNPLDDASSGDGARRRADRRRAAAYPIPLPVPRTSVLAVLMPALVCLLTLHLSWRRGAEVAVDVPKRSKKKKKQKKDAWNANQKCKSLQARGPSPALMPDPLHDHFAHCGQPATTGHSPPLPLWLLDGLTGDPGRGGVPQVPLVGAQLRFDCRGAVSLPATPLLLCDWSPGQVQVPRDGRIPGDARCVLNTSRDAAERAGVAPDESGRCSRTAFTQICSFG